MCTLKKKQHYFYKMLIQEECLATKNLSIQKAVFQKAKCNIKQYNEKKNIHTEGTETLLQLFPPQ